MNMTEQHARKYINVDEVLAEAGNFGFFQLMLVSLFVFNNILTAYHFHGQAITDFTPIYERKCDHNKSVVTASNCTILYNTTRNLEEACGKWEYSNNFGYMSITQEFNWVCHQSWIPLAGRATFFGGCLIGCLVFGIIADKFGRVPALILSYFVSSLGNLATIISCNANVYIVSRLLAGLSVDANFTMMYILVIEYLKPKRRTLVLNLIIGISFTLAAMSAPWLAVILHNWKIYLAILALLQIIIVNYIFVVPESYQWLACTGNIHRSISSLQKVAQINKKKLRQETVDDFKAYAIIHLLRRGNYTSLFALFKSSNLRKKMMLLSFKSIAVSSCIGAVYRKINAVGYPAFVSLTVIAFTNLPASLFIIMIQDCSGRKAVSFISLIVTGFYIAITAITLILTKCTNHTLFLFIAAIGCIGLKTAQMSGFQHSTELIPAKVRGQGISILNMVGYSGTFLGPHLLDLEVFWKPLPEVIIGILLMLASIGCIFLPETLNRKMPVTLYEGEKFGESDDFTDFIETHPVRKNVENEPSTSL